VTAVAPRAPGRPRDEARQACILDAALSLLAEVGYDRLTVEAVAARAGAGKATLYRRWSGKAPLVVDALRCTAGHEESWPDTGSLRGDLVAAVQKMAAFLTSTEGRAALGLLWAMQSDAELATAIRGSILVDKEGQCDQLIERARARGEIAGDNPRAAEILPSVLFGLMHVHVVVGGHPADEEFCSRVVDDVLLPVLGAVPAHSP
jgi:AcrR family transcriptional regulator